MSRSPAQPSRVVGGLSGFLPRRRAAQAGRPDRRGAARQPAAIRLAPLELLKHLAYVELRWLQWGFAGQQVEQPWADMEARGGRWRVEAGETVEDVTAFFRAQCERSRAIAASARLEDRMATLGGRVMTEAERPTLIWVCSICSRSTRGMSGTSTSFGSLPTASPASSRRRCPTGSR
jgi:hypothetical protein